LGNVGAPFQKLQLKFGLVCVIDISTSHNTYLLSRQLLGTASSSVYKHVIERGCRCVEIDAWDSEAGPIVTHGLTLTSTTPFQDVCEAIGSAVRENDWPLMISLENHADAPTQAAMVKIMTDTWGSKLVNETLEDFGPTVTPQALKGRILLIVRNLSSTS
jgi:phosphatidylinositol phospholipase C delta